MVEAELRSLHPDTTFLSKLPVVYGCVFRVARATNQPITKQLTINTGLGRMCWSEEAELRSFLRPTPSRPVLHVLENIFCVGGLEGAAQPSNTKRVFYLDMQIDFTLT